MHKIVIDGMSCSHCVKRVEDTLNAIPEISDISVSLEDNTACFRGNISDDVIIAAIYDAGYDVISISEQ